MCSCYVPAVAGLLLSFFANSQADTLRFTNHKIIDESGTGKLAETQLLPQGWTADDKLVWDFTAQKPVVSLTLHDASADGTIKTRYVNNALFVFNTGAARQNAGVLPPNRPSDFLIGQFSRTHPGVKFEVLQQDDTPTRGDGNGGNLPGMNTQTITARVKLRYSENGVPYMERASLQYQNNEMGSQVGNYRFRSGAWSMQNIAIVTAPEEKLSKAVAYMGVMMSSLKPDPAFFQVQMDITQKVIAASRERTNQFISNSMDQLRATLAQRADAYNQQQEQMSESRRQQFQTQMAAKESQARNFCDYVSDQQRFSNGSTTFIVPSGYKWALQNPDGSITVTNNPTTNANGGTFLRSVSG